MKVLLTVSCELPEMEDCSPAEAVTSIVLGALRDSDVPVTKVTVEVQP